MDYDRDNRRRDRSREYDRHRGDRHRGDKHDRSREDRPPRRSRSRSRDRRYETPIKDQSKPNSRPRSPPRGDTTPMNGTSANGTPSKPAPTALPGTPTATTTEDDAKAQKQARLAAWKREREAQKALDGAKAKAMALAGKATGSSATKPSFLPSKPTGAINRNALASLGLKGLPLKQDLVKNAAKTKMLAGGAMDDFTESTRKLEKLGDMPDVDLTMEEGGESVGENLEAADDDDEVTEKPAVQMDVDEEEEEDPLDAFMSGVIQEVHHVDGADGKKQSRLGARVDDGEDNEPAAAQTSVVDEIDATNLNPEEIMALAAKKIKKKDVAVVDHSKVTYEPFRKAFYHPTPDIAEMTEQDAENLRLALDGIKIRGVDCPYPVMKWSQCGLPASCLEVIKKLNYTAPTSIQAQAIPAIMSGRDIIGVAKTGSGKTIAFLLPLFRQIKDQRPLEQMEGPMALVMTPTRELAVQIHRECKPFLKALNLRAVCAYGGSPIKDQIAELKKGAEIIVCTPGRMIDLLTANSGRVTNLKRVTYLVLDEADRMFDMGFEPQVMKIVNNIRPDRQTVLFSATFPKQMDSLARKILNKPLEITVGGRSVVAPEITQLVEVRTEDTKFNRLLQILGEQMNDDQNARILVFVDRQEHADNLMKDLLKKNYMTGTLHGGKDQVDRDQTIADFKNGVITIVIATSVAARGLDVKQLKVVINYDAPNHMEDYVHRAGRTGRAGNKGTCITFITPDQERYSVDIFRALKASNAEVPPELEALANGFLEKVKSGNAKQASSGFGGKGLDKLDRDREEKDKVQRTVYGEREDGKVEDKAADVGGADKEGKEDPMTFGDFKVEIRRGPAPDTLKTNTLLLSASARAAKAQQDEKNMQNQIKAMQAEAERQDKNSPEYRKAMNVITKLNAQLLAAKLGGSGGISLDNAAAAARKKDPDATDFHAIIPINDYPQKARWKVTNKETMSGLIEATGASVTNKGVFYEHGKEPPPEGPPKLHLLIESNDEFRVEQAVREIKRLLIEASAQAMQAEVRGPNQTAGRYSVL